MSLDLFQLYPPQHHSISDPRLEAIETGKRRVDVVAVHGLEEDSVTAWTHSTTGRLWLRDLLPYDVDDIRVLSFSYDGSPASFFKKGLSDRLHAIAETLVAYLSSLRSRTRCLQHPIIFICHGLGGLIVKEALLYTSRKFEPKTIFYRNVYVCTTAVVFFGTPHEHVYKHSLLSISHQSRLLEHFRSSEVEALTKINRSFRDLEHGFGLLFVSAAIANDREDDSTAPSRPGAECYSISSTMAEMAQFTRGEAMDYVTVVDFLLRQTESAADKVMRRWTDDQTAIHRAFLSQINLDYGLSVADHGVDEVVSRKTSRSSWPDIRSTFSLPHERPLPADKFIGRAEEARILKTAFFDLKPDITGEVPKVFVIYGMGGSGKTELCSWFAATCRQRFHGVFTIKATSQEHIKLSFAKIGKEAGLEATEKAGQHALSILAQPFLLIVDNADDPALDLDEVLPHNCHSNILITTRNSELRRLENIGSFELKGLKEVEAWWLLFSCAKIHHPVDEPTTQLGHEICKTLGYLTLALVIAGTYIERNRYGSRLQEYLDSYKRRRKTYRPSMVRLDSGDMAKDKNISTAYPAFDVSLAYLEHQDTLACKDAIDILYMLSFYHFESIGVDIFVRASKNRLKMFETRCLPTIGIRLMNSFIGHLRSPDMLPDFLKSRAAVLDESRAETAPSLNSLLCHWYAGMETRL